jgi:bacterioferritin-associated ferredoxin
MAKFDYSFVVCGCNQVSLGEVVFAIEQQNANTIRQIGNITDAGSLCGCCQSKQKDFGQQKKKLYLETIIQKCVKSKNNN